MWAALCGVFLCLVSVVNCSENPSVIIIGAGASGIAAATKLLENNFNNITILEAERRIGGRIQSIKFGNGFVDAGAQFVVNYKAGDNFVYNLAKEYLRESSYHLEIVRSNGQTLDRQFTNEIYDFANKLRDEVLEEMEPGISIGDEFKFIYNSTFLEKYKSDAEKYKIASEAESYFEGFIDSVLGSPDWHAISLKSSFKVDTSNTQLQWNGLGYKSILDIMMKKFPDSSKSLQIDDKIILSKVVKKISWNEKQVSVECEDDTKYVSDLVLFTPSLGVLKSTYKEMFSPKLPIDNEIAIENLGYGYIMKVHLYYTDVWYDSKIWYSFMWTAEDIQKLANEFTEGPEKDGVSWLTQLQYVIAPEHDPHVLTAHFAGDMIPEMEKILDKVMMDGIMFAFNKFFGSKYNVTKPDKMLRTFWTSNVRFLGTNSFETPQGRRVAGHPNLHKDLAKPLLKSDGTPAVLFAGEATCSYYFGTAHGAVATGYREARRILELLKK